jgi:hypothetical protein
MEAQAKIIETGKIYEWHLYIEKPVERYMGVSKTKEEAYTRLHEVIAALGLTLKFDISYE